ncbi:MAG: hypothetical protein LBD24_00320 [Spirochaetaceae bacterium]|jgi:hypothetical protein|nr:hypothetical protein [Spirochaetaceae bacterium]
MNEMEADNTSAFTCDGVGGDERAACVLRLQAEIMGEIAAMQEAVRDAVVNRRWTDFESLLNGMGRYGERFQELEAERAALFDRFFEPEPPLENRGEARGAGFYGAASRLPEEKRRELSDLYRNLKLITLKVRMANESLAHYIDEARTTVDSFLDAACPARKNRFYSRRGAKVPIDMRSVVVNHSL